jgi:subtilase family protein
MRRVFFAAVGTAVLALGTASAAVGEANPQLIGEPEYVPNKVAVKFPSMLDKSTVSIVESQARLRESSYVPETGWHFYWIEDGKSPVDKAAELRSSLMIADAEATPLGHFDAFPTTPPNDPKYPTGLCPCPGFQWGLPNSNVLQAWQIAGGGPSTKAIAIVDTGIDLDHPDLGTIGGQNFTKDGLGKDDVCTGVAGHPYGHGTAVAGVAAAFTNNGKAAAGIAYGAQIWSLRISRNCTNWEPEYFELAMAWAAQQPEIWVVNLSLTTDLLPGDTDIDTIKDAVDLVWNAGRPVVAAVGNDGIQGFGNVWPAAHTNVIRVGGTELKADGTTHMWTECPFSEYCGVDGTNYGSPGIDVAAAADQLVLHKPGGGTFYGMDCFTGCSKGTSFSAPMVSGVVFLIRSRHPSWTPTQIRERLRNTADKRFVWNGTNGYHYDWPTPQTTICGGQSKELGCGVLDAAGAVQ